MIIFATSLSNATKEARGWETSASLCRPERATPRVLTQVKDGTVAGDVVLGELREATADPALLRALAG